MRLKAGVVEVSVFEMNILKTDILEIGVLEVSVLGVSGSPRHKHLQGERSRNGFPGVSVVRMDILGTNAPETSVLETSVLEASILETSVFETSVLGIYMRRSSYSGSGEDARLESDLASLAKWTQGC